MLFVFQGPDEVSNVEIYMVSDDLLLGLREHKVTAAGDRFSYQRCGLDHFGMHLSHKNELDKWHSKPTEMGVEHSEIVQSPYGHHLNFKDPRRHSAGVVRTRFPAVRSRRGTD
jgi:hypothetical protein